MASGRGNKPPPEATAPKPVEASPMQNLLDTRNKNILEGIGSGKDWTTINEFSPYLNLYNGASRDPVDIAGNGMLSQNGMTAGNQQMLGVIGKQLQSRRQQEAAGEAYNAVNAGIHDAESGGQWSAGLTQNRELGNAQMQNNRYTSWLGRPRKPSIWETILGGAFGAAGQIGGALAGGGGAGGSMHEGT